DWIDFAPGLKRIEDATRIRRSILLAFEQAELAHDDAERQRLLTFVIVGGGATGVEMAGAIAEIARQTLAKDFRRIDPRSSRIILLEAGPRILPTLPEDLSIYAERTLTRMGVDVRASTRVINCDRHGVDLDRGRIDASTIIWAAGVVASPAAHWLGAEHDQAGRVLVRPDLSVANHPEIFVIGDAAAVRDEKGAMAPGVAPAAKQMGRYVGRLIAARVAGKSSPPPFRYRSVGDLATIGRRAAVVKFGNLRLKGFVGWLFWGLAHIYFLIGVKNRFIVAFTWLWDYVTFQRGPRLITEVPPPARGEVSRRRSISAEPVISLVLPVSAEIFVGDRHLHHVFRIFEAELGRHAHLHREAVLARKDLAVELEGHLGLRMQRGRHVDRGGIALGAAKPDIFRARIV